MPGPQPPACPSWRWTSERAITGMVCLSLLVTAQSCTRSPVGGDGGLSVQAAAAAADSDRARRVTVSGIVTDDDPVLGQTLVADESRGMVVLKAPWKTRPAPGTRVVLEGQLTLVESYPVLTATRVVSTAPGRLPEPSLIEPGVMTEPEYLGKVVQLKAQVQGVTPLPDRVRLTLTSRGVQYDVDARATERALLTGFLGAQVKVTGAIWPAAAEPERRGHRPHRRPGGSRRRGPRGRRRRGRRPAPHAHDGRRGARPRSARRRARPPGHAARPGHARRSPLEHADGAGRHRRHLRLHHASSSSRCRRIWATATSSTSTAKADRASSRR